MRVNRRFLTRHNFVYVNFQLVLVDNSCIVQRPKLRDLGGEARAYNAATGTVGTIAATAADATASGAQTS